MFMLILMSLYVCSYTKYYMFCKNNGIEYFINNNKKILSYYDQKKIRKKKIPMVMLVSSMHVYHIYTCLYALNIFMYDMCDLNKVL